MATKIKSFRDLEVWRLGKEIALEVYQSSKSFPKEEMYGLVSQMRRAAVSIPSNIAEGFIRIHNKEYRQFLYMALGSCAELETQVELSCDLGFLPSRGKGNLLEKLDHESRMLKSLIKKINVST
ncbi:four helix bundle protein [Candidatus Nitronereus thalassa]|uniref:Four helix bundle protein n=1 Tax=Candidatus Nitronereus thalassa TaxID=3020898 RepID=A0ABU3K7L0_9BACT|nr:four helix bundle protein [Candidatus Nitronereus thalassa]MDT7042366.1 four helix bundle protein [Candidatus Nitronereus thalassa]